MYAFDPPCILLLETAVCKFDLLLNLDFAVVPEFDLFLELLASITLILIQ